MRVRHGRATVIGSGIESKVRSSAAWFAVSIFRLTRDVARPAWPEATMERARCSGRVIPERFFAVSVSTETQATARPATLSIPTSLAWTALMIVAGLAVYYFVGVDQGMVSLFGKDTHIHEFVHDARHFLGFPCH